MTGNSTYKRIESVKKAGEILKYLANQKEPALAGQIASSIGLAQGTLMCHLATLEDLGFIRSAGDRFELDMGIALMWSRVRARVLEERRRNTMNLEALGEHLAETSDIRSEDLDVAGKMALNLLKGEKL